MEDSKPARIKDRCGARIYESWCSPISVPVFPIKGQSSLETKSGIRCDICALTFTKSWKKTTQVAPGVEKKKICL